MISKKKAVFLAFQTNYTKSTEVKSQQDWKLPEESVPLNLYPKEERHKNLIESQKWSSSYIFEHQCPNSALHIASEVSTTLQNVNSQSYSRNNC